MPILKGLRKNQEGGSLGDSRTFPDRVLKPFAQAFETLRETDRPRLPVGIGQHEVTQQVREGLVLDGNRQVRHMDEIGGTQPPRIVLLREKHLLGRHFRGVREAPHRSWLELFIHRL